MNNYYPENTSEILIERLGGIEHVKGVLGADTIVRSEAPWDLDIYPSNKSDVCNVRVSRKEHGHVVVIVHTEGGTTLAAETCKESELQETFDKLMAGIIGPHAAQEPRADGISSDEQECNVSSIDEARADGESNPSPTAPKPRGMGPR
jgi:hypothetical protein